MKLIQCANNHYYDSDKFSSCPYCAKAGERQHATVPFGRAADSFFKDSQNPETMITEERRPMPQTTDPDEASIAYTVSPAAEPMLSPASPAETKDMESVYPPSGFPSAPQLTPESFRAPQPEPAYNAPWPSSEDSRTVSYFARNIGIEPVVGWLVAVGGKYFGEDFRLKSGRNFIGRSPEMDIQLSLDISVSRRKHAIIVYEPKSRIFIAQPGDSRELFYLNDKVVLNSTEMKDRDIITIGETKLMLVALCNTAFSWEDQKDNT